MPELEAVVREYDAATDSFVEVVKKPQQAEAPFDPTVPMFTAEEEETRHVGRESAYNLWRSPQ